MATLPKFDNEFYNTLNRRVTVKAPTATTGLAGSTPKVAPTTKPAAPSRIADQPSGGATREQLALIRNGATPQPTGTGLAAKADTIAEKTQALTGYTKPVASGAQGIKLPSYTERDQDVASHMDRLLARDSEYMKRAEAAGRGQAQGRGLLNSSISVGAARGAAMDKAFEIASQDAGQNFQRNLTNQQQRTEAAMQMRQIVSQEAISRNEIQSREAIAYAQELGALERLGMELTTEERLLKDRIDADYGLERLRQEGDVRLQGLGDASAMERLQAELSSREGIASLDNATTRRGQDIQREGQDIQRYGIDVQADTTRRGQDIDLTGIEIRSDDSRYATDASFQTALLDNETRQDIANLDAETRTRIADADRDVNRLLREMELDQQAQSSIGDAFNNAVRSYTLETQGINANTSLRAEDRQGLLDGAYGRLQDYIATTEAIYGVSLNPSAAGRGTASESSSDPPVVNLVGVSGYERTVGTGGP
ncbi:MAG: hypothetical protein AAGD08_15995 [Pseudomonadota bacterium]